MAQTLTAGKLAKLARPEGTDDDVQALMRRLLQKVASEPPARPRPDPTGNHEEVLLEVLFDDLLYQLVCRRPPVVAPPVRLSPRELEIAGMVAKGYVNKSIAAVLDISSCTVDTYLRRLFSKLGVS